MLVRLQALANQFWAQTQTFYASLSQARKVTLFAILGALVLAMVFAVSYEPQPEYVVAYTNLSAEDKNGILSHLKKNNFTHYQIEDDTLLLPSQELSEIRMSLAQEGLPSSGAGVGWESFDERSFGLSDFDQRIHKLRALQGELARTINRLEPVATSRVHIVLPDRSLFASDKQKPTASIFLKLKRAQVLSPAQVQGMIYLVAHAVEGLDPQGVTIVDQDGNMLNQPDTPQQQWDKLTMAQRDYQKRVERELEQKIKDILSPMAGYNNKIVAKVDASVDFKKVEQTISDIDPERTAVIASQRTEQSMEGSGLNPTGVPGAASNLPGGKEDLAAGGGLTNSNKSSSENLNYEVKKTLSKIVEPIGNITKINASVLVDGKMLEGKFVARTADELATMTKLVKNAIGFQDGRDALTVETAQFEPDEFALADAQEKEDKQHSLIQTAILAGVGILALIFAYFAILKPYFRWLVFDPNKRTKEHLGLVEYEFERNNASSKRIQVQEEVPFEKMSPKDQILHLAKSDPKRTTEALRHLLNPHHHS